MTATTTPNLDQLRQQIADLPTRLFTPAAWAEQAMKVAIRDAGTAEGAEKLAEARRYLACLELVERLAAEVLQLQGTQAKVLTN